jgi:hypothetical protein
MRSKNIIRKKPIATLRVRLELAIPRDVVISIADVAPAQPVESLGLVGVFCLGFVVVPTISECITQHEDL